MIYINEYNSFREEDLVREINRFIFNVNLLTEANMNWANRILNKIYNFFRTAKTISQRTIQTITVFISKLLKRLTPEKRDKFDRYFKRFEAEMVDTLKTNLKKEDLGLSVKAALNIARENKLVSKDDIKGSFDRNKDKIMELIKIEVSKKLEETKKSIMNELDNIEREVNANFVRRSLTNIKTFAIGSTFMMTFGLIDNLGMFVGMDAVESWILGLGFDSQVAAGIGNTFSDALGVVLGGAVATGLYKLLKVRSEGKVSQQFFGVIVGCMIPVVVKMLITMV